MGQRDVFWSVCMCECVFVTLVQTTEGSKPRAYY